MDCYETLEDLVCPADGSRVEQVWCPCDTHSLPNVFGALWDESG